MVGLSMCLDLAVTGSRDGSVNIHSVKVRISSQKLDQGQNELYQYTFCQGRFGTVKVRVGSANIHSVKVRVSSANKHSVKVIIG